MRKIIDYEVHSLTNVQMNQVLQNMQPELSDIASKYCLSTNEIRKLICELEREKFLLSKQETILDNTRVELREFIIQAYIENFSVQLQDKKAKILIGPPAAGKSTMVKHICEAMPLTVIDPDIVKTGLAAFEGLSHEFQNGKGEDRIYREVRYIIDKVFERLISMGENVIIPKVGADKRQILDIINALNVKGYDIELYLINLSTYQSSLRNITRFLEGLKNGNARFVDPKFIVGTDNQPIKTFCDLYSQRSEIGLAASKFHAYSNDVPYGHFPEEIEISTIKYEVEKR